jgi:autotransporter translocation and assembly factor TamB
VTGRLQAEIDLKGALLAPQGSVSLNAQDIAFDQATIGDIEIDAQGDAGAVAIERLIITQGPDRIEGRGRVDWQRQQLEGVELTANFSDPGRYLAALPLEKQNLERLQNLRGSFQTHLRLEGNFNEPQGNLDLEGQALAWEGLNIDTLKTKINHEAGRFSIEACEINNAQDAIRLRGAWLKETNTLEDARLDFRIADIKPYLDLLGRPGFQLQGDLTGSLTASGPVQAPLAVLENTSQKLRINDQELAQLHTIWRYGDKRLQVETFTASLLGGGLRLAGTLEHDEAFKRLNAQLADLAYDSPQGDLKLQKPSTVSLTTVPTFYVDELHLDGSLGTIRIAGELSPDAQLDFGVDASLKDGQGWSEDPISSGSLEAHVQVGGTWQAPTLAMDITAQELRLRPALIPPALGPFNMQGRLRYVVGDFMLETLELESPVLTITGRGRWENGPTPDSLVDDPSRWRQGTLALEGQLDSPDISWLADHIPAIRRIGGRINAQIRIDGPLSQPALDCIVALDEGELRTTADLPTLQQLSLRASATPEAVTIEYLRGLLGGSPFNLDGQVKQVFSTNPQIALHLWGENLLFFRNQDLRLRADTDLKLSGSYEDMLLAGDVAISYGRFSKYLDLLGNLQGNRPPSVNRGLQLFSLRDPPLRDLRFDVKVDSRNPFIIRNNLLRGELRADLTLKGTGELPVLDGRVFVDTGRLRLPSGSIAIENGLVQFLPDDPDRPVLDMIGRTRMLGYDITMLIEGPYDEPAITLSSVPPLANEELLMLVLTGRPPSVDGQAVAQDNTQYNVAVFVGRDLIDRWFQGSDSGSLDPILDRFESEIGRDVSQDGEETLEAQFRLADGVLHRSDSLYLTGERDVFDFYNVGLKIVFRFR